jgi:glyoxylase-like metal-dependent hydrolase (beta-lactamase superfamily II)
MEAATFPLPVVPVWYVASDLGQGITLIDQPHVHPFVRANIWHIRGSERDILIDCGLGVSSLKRALPGLFEREPVLILTHTHLDHMGGAYEFESCWAHPAEPAADPAPGSLEGDALAACLGLDLQNLDEPFPALMISALPDKGYDPRSYALRGCAVSGVLNEGDVVELGDRRFRVLHLPGHSPGSIALNDEQNGILFAGDVIYDDYLVDNVTGSDISKYLASMDRLRNLPVERVYPGHGSTFGNARMDEIASAYIEARSQAFTQSAA